MRLHLAWRVVLWPLAFFYGLIVRGRAELYRTGILKQKRLPGLVVSVGNLSVGGTGKTPLVIWLAERLSTQGKRLGILSRGYRGEGASSDEVEMMRLRLGAGIPVALGADRYASGVKLAEEGIDCFLLDDGFQHLALARDVDIVVLDGTEPLAKAALLPAGRLREPLSSLRRADIVVVTRTTEAPEIETEVSARTDAPIFYTCIKLLDFCPFVAGKLGPGSTDAVPAKTFAFCGIGNPVAFFSDLRAWGVMLAGRKVFRDHHRYTQADAERLEGDAMRAHATALVCTEKDTMNLAGVQFRLPVYACRIELDVSAGMVETVLRIAEEGRKRTA